MMQRDLGLQRFAVEATVARPPDRTWPPAALATSWLEAPASNLGADNGSGPGIGVDLYHGLPPARGTSGETLEAVGTIYNRHPHRVPTMLATKQLSSLLIWNIKAPDSNVAAAEDLDNGLFKMGVY
jgi:hypothetical protein